MTSAVRAPFRSMMAFVKSVVPWRTWDTRPAGTRAAASTASIPAMTASSGRSGVVSTLPTWKVWPSSLARMRSVNVPPISDPTRYKVTPSGKSNRGQAPTLAFAVEIKLGA